MRWYRAAAEQNFASDQDNPGVMYENGQGVPQDYVQAYLWFSLAAMRVSASGAEDRMNALGNRDRIAAKKTAAQIAEAERLTREWKLR